MSGRATRSKGRRGQQAFTHMLKDRDWTVAELNAGTAAEDLIATDPHGNTWSIEVKNTVAITTAHRAQAMTQAKQRKLPWLLASHVAGTGFWLVQRQAADPVLWRQA